MNLHSNTLSKHTRLPLFAVLTLALVGLGAGEAEAQQTVIQPAGGGTGVTSSGPTEQIRLNAYGILRGGGSWRGRTDGPDFSSGMGVGGGFGARLEIAVHDYVVIGPLLEVQFLNPGRFLGFGIDRYSAINFGVWSKGRYVLDLAGNPLELYVGMPLAVAVYVPSDRDVDTRAGVSVGLMFGAQLFINDTFGFMLETGFRRDGFRDKDVDVRFRTMQFVMNAGISIAF